MNLVNVEYRLANTSLAPAAVEDCRCALRWVHRHAKEYGFDTTKLVVAGHSAGGHLALMTGMLGPSSEFDSSCAHALGHDELKVAAIVNFFGPTDVTDLLEGPHQQDWAVEWFGSLPNRMELAKKLSPLTYVHSGLPPIITLHGDLDEIVPYQPAVSLHKALDGAGVPNQIVTVPGGGHAGWTREQNLMVHEAIFSFLEKQGILSIPE
jgi:acetyl esterase/lipase